MQQACDIQILTAAHHPTSIARIQETTAIIQQNFLVVECLRRPYTTDTRILSDTVIAAAKWLITRCLEVAAAIVYSGVRLLTRIGWLAMVDSSAGMLVSSNTAVFRTNLTQQ